MDTKNKRRGVVINSKAANNPKVQKYIADAIKKTKGELQKIEKEITLLENAKSNV